MALQALKVNASLKEIYLTSNAIGAEGAKALAEVHEQMPMQM